MLLGGWLMAVVLNMLVVPALFLWYGVGRGAPGAAAPPSGVGARAPLWGPSDPQPTALRVGGPADEAADEKKGRFLHLFLGPTPRKILQVTTA